MQNTLWFTHKPKIQIQQKPVLDENRNRIITYDRNIILQQSNKNYNDDDWKNLKSRGYQILGEIGRGGYGVVYKAKNVKDPTKLYAIKKNFDVVARSTIYLQVAFFHLVRKKRNLPRMVDLFFLNETPYVILQYFEHQSYQQIFDTMITLLQIKHYMIQLLKGINTLKNLGVYHRDIKPHNFLYNKIYKKGIIIDFGLAQIDPDFVQNVIQKKYVQFYKKIPQKQRKKNQLLHQKKNQWNLYKKILKANQDHGFNKIGTQSYVPLQTLLNYRDQGHQCQIWSAGVIFMQFLTQKMHFFNQPKFTNIQNAQYIKYICIFVMQLTQIFGKSQIQQHLNKMDWRVIYPKTMQQKGNLKKMIVLRSNDKQNQFAFDLLIKMITLSPKERICVEDAIWHPFFDQVREGHFQSTSEKKWYKQQYQRRRKKPLQPADKQRQQQQFPNQNSLIKSFSQNAGESSYSRNTTKKYDDNSQNSSSEIDSSYIKKYKQQKNKSNLIIQNYQLYHDGEFQNQSNEKKNMEGRQQDKQEKQNNKESGRVIQCFKTNNVKQPTKNRNNKIAKNEKIAKNNQQKQHKKSKKQQRIIVDEGYQPPRGKFNRYPVPLPPISKNIILQKQSEPFHNKPTLTLQQLLKKQQERLQKQRNQGIKSNSQNKLEKKIQ